MYHQDYVAGVVLVYCSCMLILQLRERNIQRELHFE